ncbi:carbonic anhydrase [Streptomyces sp. NPDC048290]|uniref:carbonic anhydrase n=1 Tax=Streptomyces sp. NPDC048290 TaxID=3155811 RepID=UPI003420E5F3
MKKLLDNARTFHDRVAPQRDMFRRFAAGQSPSTLFITCSDSRVVPALILRTGPGEVFELRNAGNIVPPYDPDRFSGEAATLQYAVDVLQVKDVVVCGHSHCGAIGAVASGQDLAALPSVDRWVSFARPGLSPLLGAPPQDPAMAAFVQRHVAAQLDTLRGYPEVASAAAAGRLRLHGWYYRVDTAEVLELDEGDGEFHLH